MKQLFPFLVFTYYDRDRIIFLFHDFFPQLEPFVNLEMDSRSPTSWKYLFLFYIFCLFRSWVSQTPTNINLNKKVQNEEHPSVQKDLDKNLFFLEIVGGHICLYLYTRYKMHQCIRRKCTECIKCTKSLKSMWTA